MTLSTYFLPSPQKSWGSTLPHINDWQTSSSGAWDGHGTSSPAIERVISMSVTAMSVSGECHQTVRTYSTGCQSLRRKHLNHGNCQWHQLACWWRHTRSLNWSSSTQSVMNWHMSVYYPTTYYHGTLWSHQLEHLSSVTTTNNCSRVRWVKSILAVRCYVSSAVHICHHSATFNTLPLTLTVTYL